MTFTVLTLFPGLFEGFLGSSILARAIERGRVTVRCVDIRDYATDKHHVCDDAAYGGGPGMVMKPEPIAAALEAVRAAGAPGQRVVYLTPAGRPYTQRVAEELAREQEVTLLCGRYEGIDQRVIDAFVTDELSVGDYVLSGGEVAAMVVVDSVARLLEGVITQGLAGGGELLPRAAGVPALHAARGVPRDAGAGGAAVGAPREDPPVAASEEHREDDGGTVRSSSRRRTFLPRRAGCSLEQTRREKETSMDMIKAIEAEQLKENAEEFRIGDTVKVHFKIIEGKTERVQVFEGIVIAMKRDGPAQDLHRPQDLLRRGRREDVPPALARRS